MEENGLQSDDICAIPVSFDGIVDTESGIIYYPIHNSGWGRNIPGTGDAGTADSLEP